MITRNCFGKIEPRIGSYIVQKEWNGWKIVKRTPYYRTDVTLVDNPWCGIELFDSMVKAYVWLKKRVDELF